MLTSFPCGGRPTLAQAVGQIVYTAQAIMENAADKVCGAAGPLTDAALRTRLGDAPAATTADMPTLDCSLLLRTQYPFGGLPNFPEAYPILLSGSAQSNTTVGQSVTGACAALPCCSG